MDGITVGVFGTDKEVKSAFEAAVAKKSEAEGITVFSRTDGGRRYSLLDTADFPERVQGYARIASLVDHALFLYPGSGKLSAPDGELAVLLTSFGLRGTLQLLQGVAPESAVASLKGTSLAQYLIDVREPGAASIDLSAAGPRSDFPSGKTLVYIDRVFTVKGVGTVALGFVLSGTVSIHDQLRPVPGPSDLRADVKGIQVSDVDFESAGRGIRVGLSLRGVEPKDLERSHWLDDGSLTTTDSPQLNFAKSPFYRPEVLGRDLHLQLPGELVPATISKGRDDDLMAKLPWPVPVWEGGKGALVDLNGASLRVAGGATFKF